MNIIGIAGKMECGKTTLANYLKSLLPDVEIVNFGDILKEEVAEVYNFPLGWCYSEEGKMTAVDTKGASVVTPDRVMNVRELLQWYGTDYMRAKNPDHWVDEMRGVVAELVDGGSRNIIIADIRFPNEADFVTENLGKVTRLHPYPGWSKESDHDSETALDGYDAERKFWLDIAPPFGSLCETAKYIVNLQRELVMV